MLASVCSAAEAEIAVSAGADLIDLKDPATGALGALPPATIAECVRQIAGRRPVSATIGDIGADAAQVTAGVARTAAAGVDLVKVGLFGTGPWRTCLEALSDYAPRVVVVLFCDQRAGFDMLPDLAAVGFAGAMIDTADKGSGGLTGHMTRGELVTFTRSCRQLGLLSGLAGSLRLADIDRLLPVAPDYLGFRTALCRQGERRSGLDSEAVAGVRSAIPRVARPPVRSWSGSGSPAGDRAAARP